MEEAIAIVEPLSNDSVHNPKLYYVATAHLRLMILSNKIDEITNVLTVFYPILGVLHEAQGHTEEAMAWYKNALSVNAAHVDSKVKLGALLCQRGSKQSLPVARSLLAEALQAEPTHEAAWFQMGCLHKAEGHPNEAADCFQAAVLLEQSLPVEKFRSIPRALSIKS